MASDRIIVQFVGEGLWVMAVKMSAKNQRTVFSAFSSLEAGRISPEILDRLRAAINVRRCEVIMILPQRQVIYKYFTLPSKDKNELRRMIGLQVGQGLPFSQEEIVYDIASIDQNGQGLSQVVVAICRQKTVEQCLKLVNDSGFAVSRAVVSSLGLCAWFSNYVRLAATDCAVVVDVQSQHLEFCVCRNNKHLFTRVIALSEADVSSGLIQQIDATLEAFERAYPENAFSRLVLTGAVKHRKQIKTALVNKLQISCEDVDAQDGREEAHPDVSLNAANGISSIKEWKLDLMPSSAHQVSVLNQEKVALARVFVALAIFVLALMALSRGQLSALEKQLQAAHQVIVQNKQAFQKAKRNFLLHEVIANEQKRKVVMAELFKELYAALAPSVVLSNLQYSDGTLTILGQTKESADVGVVQKALMGSPMFTDVTLQYANRPQRLGMELTEFKMVCRLKTAASESP